MAGHAPGCIAEEEADADESLKQIADDGGPLAASRPSATQKLFLLDMPPEIVNKILGLVNTPIWPMIDKCGFASQLTVSKRWYELASPVLLGREKDNPLVLTPERFIKLMNQPASKTGPGNAAPHSHTLETTTTSVHLYVDQGIYSSHRGNRRQGFVNRPYNGSMPPHTHPGQEFISRFILSRCTKLRHLRISGTDTLLPGPDGGVAPAFTMRSQVNLHSLLMLTLKPLEHLTSLDIDLPAESFSDMDKPDRELYDVFSRLTSFRIRMIDVRFLVPHLINPASLHLPLLEMIVTVPYAVADYDYRDPRQAPRLYARELRYRMGEIRKSCSHPQRIRLLVELGPRELFEIGGSMHLTKAGWYVVWDAIADRYSLLRPGTLDSREGGVDYDAIATAWGISLEEAAGGDDELEELLKQANPFTDME